METLRSHKITLQSEHIRLRPLSEGDWELLARWNRDAEILYFTEGEAVAEYGLEEVQEIYRTVSQTAFCFVIERDESPVGECWLQQMNLERILRQYPDLDCRRIDLMIGERTLWGQGIGTRVIRLLCQFGFEIEKADAIFACDLADYNLRSIKAFRKVGFEVINTIPQPPENKALYRKDLILTWEKWHKSNEARVLTVTHKR